MFDEENQDGRGRERLLWPLEIGGVVEQYEQDRVPKRKQQMEEMLDGSDSNEENECCEEKHCGARNNFYAGRVVSEGCCKGKCNKDG